jgi:short-subunit dehydrogenase
MAKSIFITGGTSGIGLAVAKVYKDRGFRVAICGRNQEVLNEYSSVYEVFKVDVTNLSQVEFAIKNFAEGGLDIVYANAGIGYEHKKRLPDFDRARQIVDININGVLNTFEVATNIFLENGHGHLVATASIAGFNGLPGVPAYSGSKSAIIKICESLRLDLKHRNINVTCVCPGFVDTPLTKKNPHSMPFLTSPEDIALKIYEGVDKNKRNILYPRLFARVVLLLSFLPRVLYDKIVSKPSLDYSKE